MGDELSPGRGGEISFSTMVHIVLARESGIFKNVKEKRFKELRKTLLEQKYPKSLIEARILRAKEIPLEILRQPKIAKNEEIIPFTTTYNPNNPNIFPIIKQNFENFQYSKTMSSIFQRKLVKSMSQAPNLGRLLSRSKF